MLFYLVWVDEPRVVLQQERGDGATVEKVSIE
jgi:hypothetical protein